MLLADQAIRLTVSIVAYKSGTQQFQQTIESLCAAVVFAKQRENLNVTLYIIDNEVKEHANINQARLFFSAINRSDFNRVILSVSPRNLGYGRGHNVAIFGTEADYYLVLNPDVIMETDALDRALSCMKERPSAAVVTPQGESPEGDPLYLCKRYPLIFDLFLRAFAPQWMRRRFLKYIARYEMHELKQSLSEVQDIPIVSGCCMLLRGSSLRAVGGFDERYFLYFEDFDLSLRLSAIGSNVYLPTMRIIHYGGHAARKGLWHIFLFGRSATRFYSQYGWRWFRY